jgi:hypothetical protein
MALTATPLVGNIDNSQTNIRVTSSTGFVVGNLAQIESEYVGIKSIDPNLTTSMVVSRGQGGTVAVAHKASSSVVTGPANEFPMGDHVTPAADIFTYGAAGALVVAAGLHELNTGAASAMTLANPTVAQDGLTMTIVAKTAHAYTVAAASAFQGLDTGVTATWAAAIGNSMVITAMAGRWQVIALGNVTVA